jgi:hypothetical protein
VTEGNPKVFVSYRRQDAAYPTGSLRSMLVGRFGAENVFKDVGPGRSAHEDSSTATERAILRSDVLLAVIGDRWLTATGVDGEPSLNAVDDYVRLEIEAALRYEVPVIAVLADSRMPRAQELPPSIAPLASAEAFPLSPYYFVDDAHRVMDAVVDVFRRRRASEPTSTAPGIDDTAIVPLRSVAGIEFGATESVVRERFGEPDTVDEFDGRKFSRYLTYYTRGLTVLVRRKRLVRAFFCYPDGLARPAGSALYGDDGLGPSYRAFRGTTSEGIAVTSTRSHVEAAYGVAPIKGAPTLDAYVEYDRLGLSFEYATRDPDDEEAPISVIKVTRPSPT